MNIPIIKTERLILRSYKMDDLDAYAKMCSDSETMKFIGGNTLNYEQTLENMAVIQGHWMLRGYGIWAIECVQTGAFIGRAGLLNLYGWPGIEVCWALSPDHRGKGYATEAVNATIDWAFNNKVTGRLISLIHPYNVKSIAVAERVGEVYKEQIAFKGNPAKVYEICSCKNA
jgi:RimJ/RimL family protein N-acetyltransferase